MVSQYSGAVSSKYVQARFPVALLAVLLCHCGPWYEDGGSGCSPSGGPSATGGAGGYTASGGSGGPGGAVETGGCAGAGSSVSGGCAGAGGSGATGGSAGGGGGSTSPGTDAVIGCAPATWPEAGLYFEPQPAGEFADRSEILLSSFTAYGLSGDGKVVVGVSPDEPYSRGIPVAWSLANGLVELPVPFNYETWGIQASCDGSVVLERDVPFGQVWRVQGSQTPEVVLNSQPPLAYIHTNPDVSLIVNGYGVHGEFDSVPAVWTSATGMTSVPALTNDFVYGVAPDGTLIAADTSALFEYDVASDSETPIGITAVDLGGYAPTVAVGAGGNAWVQSADLHLDSFLVWRPPAEPFSVTCPLTCQVVDVSSTAQIALFDVPLSSSDARFTSSIWTRRDGLLDLAVLFEQNGFDLHGRKLRAVAISDDGRAFAGYSFDPTITQPGEQKFFYAVLPVAVYQ